MKDLKIKATATIVKDNKILLIKEKNINDGEYYWNLIKGTFEPEKDKSLINTVIRECKEEINIQVKIKKLINIIYYRKNNKIRFQFNFLCKGPVEKSFLTSMKKQKSRNENIAEIKLFTKNQLLKMRKNEFMNERTFIVLNDFIKGKRIHLPTFKEISRIQGIFRTN